MEGVLSEDTVDIDSNLSCSAVGFPAPDVYWLNVLTGLVTSSANLTMTTLGQNHFICMATNVIRGELYSAELDVEVNVTGAILQ